MVNRASQPLGGLTGMLESLAAGAEASAHETTLATAAASGYHDERVAGEVGRLAKGKSGKGGVPDLRRELIRQITDNQRVAVGKLAEAQSYAPVRELLKDPRLGLGVPAEYIVVDSPVPFGRERPDVQVWLEGVPTNLRNEGEHLYAIVELKSGTKVRNGGRAIARSELETYNYAKLRHFYLADAEIVQRYDLAGGGVPEPRTAAWADLAEDEAFMDFFAPLGAERRTLRSQLRAFAHEAMPPGRPIAEPRDRKRFVDAVVTTARILSLEIDALVERRLIPDLKAARAAIDAVEQTYGKATFDFRSGDFVRFANEPPVGDTAAQAAFNEVYTALLGEITPALYALNAEHLELPSYANRSGLTTTLATFVPTAGSKEARDVALSARVSYVQETATLLFSRLLMIRFSEDHALLPRILSNGGLTAYARFADEVDDRFQSLVLTAYRRARPIYRHLFEAKPLDWLLDGDDRAMSDALLHVMWILAGWDFTTVRGDILAGIYDRNLDKSQRAALGEVYTRPELAAYLLGACGYDGSQTVLDPACGSGTFLVEAFEHARRGKEALGIGFSADDAIETLSRIKGLDLNGFSATLAQIQLLWHVLSVDDGDPVELMSRAIAAMNVEGGHSSIETWGASMRTADLFGGEIARSNEEVKATAGVADARLRNADRRFRDLSAKRHGYGVVVGNPPYVRVHRLRMTAEQDVEYAELKTKQSDLSVFFTYRAIEWWAAPGGRVGFYLPLAITEAAYAEPLRAVLNRYRIVEIIDLEEIGNVAFHGANVVTIGLVVEKAERGDDDMVKLTRVTRDCLDHATGRIDMQAAVVDMVPASAIELGRYLPRHGRAPMDANGAVTLDGTATTIGHIGTAVAENDDADADADDGDGGSDSALLTKIRTADVAILDRIALAPRLDTIVLRGWKSRKKGKARFAAEIPNGEKAGDWRQARVMGYGVKVGGRLPNVEGGKPVYKAKHLPPDGTLTIAPVGRWDGDGALVDTVRFYAWDGIGAAANTYAIRNIATQPVFAPHPQGAYLTNTVYCMRLSEPFPLHVWSVSRIVAWFMAKTARTSVVQGYFSTFYQRQTLRIPIPADRGADAIKILEALGTRLFDADAEIARGTEALQALADGNGSKPLRNRGDLIAAQALPRPADVAFPDPAFPLPALAVTLEARTVRFTTVAPTPVGEPADPGGGRRDRPRRRRDRLLHRDRRRRPRDLGRLGGAPADGSRRGPRPLVAPEPPDPRQCRGRRRSGAAPR